MPLQNHSKTDVLHFLSLLQSRVSMKDPDVMRALSTHASAQQTSVDVVHAVITKDLSEAIKTVSEEDYHAGEQFHSRNAMASLAQAHLNADANGITHNSIGDALPAVVNLFGEGNPVVWAPVMVNIFLEHLKPKAAFQRATDENSYIEIPAKCSIALLGDWGADNDHAQRISEIVRQREPTYAIHLGDIYYAGNQYESERFLDNWPMGGYKNSFALNGNHEMYSRGIPYFGTILPAFKQEASYFTLYNSDWQIHGLDTAYVPFSIDGSVQVADPPSLWHRIFGSIAHLIPSVQRMLADRQPDDRLRSQWDWLLSKVKDNPTRKNIFLSHNQPVSAYLPEFQAGAFLHEQFRNLQQALPNGADALLAWFFGHEHKCTIYSDENTDFRARLIGNGAIPHSRQAMIAAQKDETNTACTPVYTMNDRTVKHDMFSLHNLDLAISGFALLTLDGPEATVEYVNEDGSLFLREKLTGKPNEVLEWGAGYGPLQRNM